MLEPDLDLLGQKINEICVLCDIKEEDKFYYFGSFQDVMESKFYLQFVS